MNFIHTDIGFGTALAITISWSLNKSIFWAIIHGIFGWLYVIYYAIGNPNNDNMNEKLKIVFKFDNFFKKLSNLC